MGNVAPRRFMFFKFQSAMTVHMDLFLEVCAGCRATHKKKKKKEKERTIDKICNKDMKVTWRFFVQSAKIGTGEM